MNAQIVIDPQNDFCPGGALPGYVSSPDDVRCAICLCNTPCAGAQRCCNFCIGSLHIKQYVAAKRSVKLTKFQPVPNAGHPVNES